MEHDLAQQLAGAHREGRHDVDPASYARLDRVGAYAVQSKVRDLLGEGVGAIKVAVAPDGTGLVAPIFASRVGASGSVRLPAANVVGLEVEIAAVLGRDIDAGLVAQGDDAMLGAIDHFVLGLEICGSRFPDRTAAGAEGGLADGMSSLGYVYATQTWTGGLELAGSEVVLEFGGKQIYAAPARHSFGTVLASFFAYARTPRPELPLRKGLLVTTGSLCGLVPVSGTGRAVGRFGGQSVEVELVA